ncbi:hypothetical protein [Nocardioides zhouii]|uniref:Uncharacterized protein n=1 Tax=Nocardioides zhouii TaxID=1168729 RepID=A0A4Q2T3L7_9ACTN|nr:hypothetical protein [Nocardioides zhouii]RYC13346.1 hypothetical protein EUA94_05595 [Nocardioides zhouii]
MRVVAAAVGAAVVGAVSAVAGTLLHQQWWGLALGLVAGLVTLAWLPPGVVRLAFAVGWCLTVLRGALERPAGGFLIGSDSAGWSFVVGSFVLLVAALATVRSGAAARRGSGTSAAAHLNSPRGEEPPEH